ncbi:hypothetical protein BDK51DRAFT_44839, partial [Blyttiomyces helicus]
MDWRGSLEICGSSGHQQRIHFGGAFDENQPTDLEREAANMVLLNTTDLRRTSVLLNQFLKFSKPLACPHEGIRILPHGVSCFELPVGSRGTDLFSACVLIAHVQTLTTEFPTSRTSAPSLSLSTTPTMAEIEATIDELTQPSHGKRDKGEAPERAPPTPTMIDEGHLDPFTTSLKRSLTLKTFVKKAVELNNTFVLPRASAFPVELGAWRWTSRAPAPWNRNSDACYRIDPNDPLAEKKRLHPDTHIASSSRPEMRLPVDLLRVLELLYIYASVRSFATVLVPASRGPWPCTGEEEQEERTCAMNGLSVNAGASKLLLVVNCVTTTPDVHWDDPRRRASSRYPIGLLNGDPWKRGAETEHLHRQDYPSTARPSPSPLPRLPPAAHPTPHSANPLAHPKTMSRPMRTLIVRSLPPGKDRADLLDFIRSNHGSGFRRIVYERDDRTYLLFSDVDRATAVLEHIRRSTVIHVDYAREDISFRPPPRSNVDPNPIVRIQPSSTPLSREELEKIMRCYRGFEFFEILEDEDSESPLPRRSDGRSSRSGSARAEMVPYAGFRDLFCAEQAVDDLYNFTNVYSSFSSRPDRVRIAVEQRQRAAPGQPAARIDALKAAWLRVTRIPEDVSYGTMKRHFNRLEGFSLLCFQPNAFMVAFDSEDCAERAAENLLQNTKMDVRRADLSDVDSLRIPPIRKPGTATAVLHIRLHAWMPPRRISELLRLYSCLDDVKVLKDSILAFFDTVEDAAEARLDLEKTTDFIVEYTNNDHASSGIQDDGFNLGGGGAPSPPPTLPCISPPPVSASAASEAPPIPPPVGSTSHPAPLPPSSSSSQPPLSPPSEPTSAIFIPANEVASAKFSLRHQLGNIDGFERMTFQDEGLYAWFRSRDHAARAAGRIEGERRLSPTLVERAQPRVRLPPLQPPHAEHYMGALYIRAMPCLPRDTLQHILEGYSGYMTCRHTKEATLVDYVDQETATKVLLDLRATTNIRPEYSNRSAQPSNRYMTDDRWENGSNGSEGSGKSDATLEFDRSPPPAALPGCRTIYVTSLGTKDKADIKQVVVKMPGFVRVQFGQTNFRVVLRDPAHAQIAMERMRNAVRSWKMSYARKEPETKRIEELGEPSKTLWTSTLYWTEAELRKYLSQYRGYERLDFDSAHSWVHFRDLECAHAALTDMNTTTNLYSVYSSKKFDREMVGYAAATDVPSSAMAGLVNAPAFSPNQRPPFPTSATVTSSLGIYDPGVRHAWDSVAAAAAANAASDPLRYGSQHPLPTHPMSMTMMPSVFAPAHHPPLPRPPSTTAAAAAAASAAPRQTRGVVVNLAHQPTPAVAPAAGPITSMRRPSRSALDDGFFVSESGDERDRTRSSPFVEHFPIRRGEVESQVEMHTNVVMIRNSFTNDPADLTRIFEVYPGFDGLATERKGAVTFWFVRFADLESAEN